MTFKVKIIGFLCKFITDAILKRLVLSFKSLNQQFEIISKKFLTRCMWNISNSYIFVEQCFKLS